MQKPITRSWFEETFLLFYIHVSWLTRADLEFIMEDSKVVYHLPQIPGNSSWDVKGKRFSGSSHWKISKNSRDKRKFWKGSPGRFPFRKKTPKFRWEQKWNFRLVISCSPLVLNPGTSRCPTVDLELVRTTRNVNGTRHSVRKFQPGKRAHLFRFSTFSGNFPVGRADETCSIYRRTRNSGNFD